MNTNRHSLDHILGINKAICNVQKRHVTQEFYFKWCHGQSCRWLLGTKRRVKTHVDDVIIVWHNTHTNTKPIAIWFPVMLTDTNMNIEEIHVKYHMYGNYRYNIPATESKLWGTSLCYLFSASVYMVGRGDFGNFSTKDLTGTIKNCVHGRGSSKGYS